MRQRPGFSLLPFFGAMLLVFAPLNRANSQTHQWVGSWASAQMLVETKDELPRSTAGDMTLRQLVRVTTGGRRLRVTVSNVFGTAPLVIDGVNVARAVSRASSKIDPASDRAITFAGARSISIPAGAEYVSDAIDFVTPQLSTLAISMHLPQLPIRQTGHPGSRATSYLGSGDQLSASELRAALTADHWYFLSGVDVIPDAQASAIAVLGDSITDGHGVISNTDTRWPDYLAQRLKERPRTRSIAVLNLGIGGNRLVDDGLGPNAAARFDRDVLERSSVKYLIILEGVNDLGVLTRDSPASAPQHQMLVQRMISAYAQIVARAREHGIKVIGATILPFGASDYYHPGAATEADRQAINAWIRARGHVDAILDFDALMRDPAHPERMRKELDSDGLHPNAAGYRLMGEAVPLSLFGAN